MKLLASLFVVALATVFGLTLSAPLAERWEDNNSFQRQSEMLRLQRERYEFEMYQQRQNATLAGKIAADYGLLLLIGVGIVGAYWLAKDSYMQRRTPLTRYINGLPVARHMVESGDPRLLEMMVAALQLDGSAAIERARASQAVPTSYAPHITVSRTTEAYDAAPQAPVMLTATGDTSALPEEAPFADMRSTMEPGRIVYGVLAGNKPLVLTYGQSYHGLAAGDTRTGKSNWLDSIITQLHYHSTERNIRLWIGDYKREMQATWSRSPLPSAIETDPGAIADMLVELANGRDGILRRYEHFKRYGESHGRIVRNLADYVRASGHHPKLTFCVIDEINALIEACDERDELASALKIVLQLGAGAGVYVLGGAQYLTAKTLGRDASKQFTTRTLFGSYDQTAALMLFGAGKLPTEHREMLTGIPGRGLIRTTGHSRPEPFQALHCGESDILAAIAHVSNGVLEDKQPTVDVSASETGINGINGFTQSSKISRNSGEIGDDDEVLTESGAPHSNALTTPINGIYEPALYYGVQALRANGASKTAIIKTLWKVTSGPPWQKASTEYEAIVNALEVAS